MASNLSTSPETRAYGRIASGTGVQLRKGNKMLKLWHKRRRLSPLSTFSTTISLARASLAPPSSPRTHHLRPLSTAKSSTNDTTEEAYQRKLSWNDVARRKTSNSALRPVPLANFGRTHTSRHDLADVALRFTRGFASSAKRREAMERTGGTSEDLNAPPPLSAVQVPLISPYLQSQVFPSPSSPFFPPPPSPESVDISLSHLRANGLLAPEDSPPPKRSQSPAVNFTLPQLQGPTISHHFHALGSETAEPYLSFAKSFADAKVPPMPHRWERLNGWTYYAPDGSWEPVDFPREEEDAMVFDVETLPFKGSHYPVMAAAIGKEGWYAWCSPWLTGDSDTPNHLIPFNSTDVDATATPSSSESDKFFNTTSDLFERPSSKPRVLIGHNVLFDRARVASEYTLRRPSTRWIDTLSLHVAVSGLTSPQRPSWMKYRKDLERAANGEGVVEDVGETKRSSLASKSKAGAEVPKTWKDLASINSLVEVARLHCGIIVDKSLRDTFIDPETTIEDVRNDFDELMTYCARDVQVTLDVYQSLLPKFLQTCPHPVSFSGILLMSQPILPVDYRWPQYLDRAEHEYTTRLQGVRDALRNLAEDARTKFDKMGKNGKYEWEEDIWLRQLDWSPKKARRLPGDVPSKRRKSTTIKKLLDATSSTAEETESFYWRALLKDNSDGAPVIPLQSPLAHLLFRTTWKGFPVVHTDSHGWLFAVPQKKGKRQFVPAEREDLVPPELLGAKDSVAGAIEGVQLYTVPSRSTGRCRTLIATSQTKNVDNGVLESPFDDFPLAVSVATQKSGSDFDDIQLRLRALVEDALTLSPKERSQDPWLRQLDWSPATKRSRRSLPLPSEEVAAIKPRDLIWPKWYWDLDRPGEGLDMSIGKRTAQLLLKLRWNGHPVVHSKEHGWIYRVPQEAVDEAALASLKPVNFKLAADLDLFGDSNDSGAYFIKLPHPDGEGKNVGSALSRPFVAAFEDGLLSSEYPAAADALSLNASCSYWASARERIMGQMVVWGGDAAKVPPSADTPSQTGFILPQVIPMGTITRRAVEKTWLTASNAKKNRVGSELKAMIRAPPGYAIVGADVDSEELWICSVMGDAQFGIHGATAVGWMTLEGTKSAGTDLHSKSASILGITRDNAKAFNYSRIYGAGLKHAVTLLLKCNPTLTTEQATTLVKSLYASTKGLKSRTGVFNREFWHGGTESFVFNKLEEIAQMSLPRTPALGCGLTQALRKANLPAEGRSRAGEGYMPSRINWVVQSSGVDYLHLLLVSMEYLCKRFFIDARYMISVHDEIRYLVKDEDKYRAAMALQVANVWTRTMFSYRLQMGDLPQSCAFFSAVDVDHCFRKEVNMTCLTPSNPDSIEFGESLEITDSLDKTFGGSLFADGRPMVLERELPQLPVTSHLTEVDILGEPQRPDGMAFLNAQTTRSAAAIRKAWDAIRPSNWKEPEPRFKRPKSGRKDSEPDILDAESTVEGLGLEDMAEAMQEDVAQRAASRKAKVVEPVEEEEEEPDYGEDDLDVPEEIEEEGFSIHATANRRTHA